MVNFRISLQEIKPANYVIHIFIAKLSKEFTYLFCQEPEIRNNIIGFSSEPLSQFRVLCCHTYRTCIEMAFTHHNTTHYNQCRRRETKFLGTKQGSNNYILSA